MAIETKTVDSIISDAQKEGIDYSEKGNDSPSPESQAKPDATPASSATPESKVADTPAADGDKSAEAAFQESKLPAHLFPQFKQLFIEKRQLEKKLKDKDGLLSDPRVARLLAQGKAQEEVVKEEPKPVAPAQIAQNGQVTD